MCGHAPVLFRSIYAVSRGLWMSERVTVQGEIGRRAATSLLDNGIDHDPKYG